MNRTGIVALALAGLLALATPAQAGAYVRLSELAQRYGLTTDVDLITGRATLSDGRNKVALVPGGYQVLVNGRAGLLPERIGVESGDLIVPVAAVPFLDREIQKGPAAPPVVAAARPATTVQASAKPAAETLAPNTDSVVFRGRVGTIVIDPGHGGVHTGAKGRAGVVEKDVTLGISRILKPMLEARGWKVVLTRSDDRQLSPEINHDLDARVALAARSKADAFVSVHANYAESASAQGFEIFCTSGRPKDAALARAIWSSMKQSIPDEDRGVKNAGFRVIKRATMPAVLVEVGFVSHPPTERKLATEEYRRRLAEAICRGIDRWTEIGRIR